MAHTRCARRKTKRRQVWERVRAAFHQHALTLRLPAQALEDWHTWATQQVRVFQRASSAVEGRNGALAQLHHHQRKCIKAAGQGVDSPVELRLSCRRWHDACSAILQARVSRPF